MDFCLDSNVFSSDPDFFVWMGKKDIKGYLSSLALMELSYYEMKRIGGSMVRLLSTINGLDIEIVPFDKTLAMIAAKNALPWHDMSRNAMDYAIGAYAYKRKIPMVTNNKKHFKWLDEVYTPAEIMQKY
jgi:tRNA(fMet)-specific endonuclease VapC